MGLRIRTNTTSQVVQKNLRKSSEAIKSEMAKLSSGKRITRAADDAAGLAIATNLEAQVRGLGQASRNASDGISLVQTAEGGLSEISNILIRLRELSVQSASDTVGEKERVLLNQEYGQLIKEVDRIAESTTFNGTNLLNGDSGRGTLEFHVGSFAGDVNKIAFDADINNASSEAIGVGSLQVDEKEGANEAIEQLDESINQVSAMRANLGAVQSRLASTVSNLEVQRLNQSQALSVIADVDVAQATASLAAKNVIKMAGISTLSQANNIPNAAVRLIG